MTNMQHRLIDPKSPVAYSPNHVAAKARLESSKTIKVVENNRWI